MTFEETLSTVLEAKLAPLRGPTPGSGDRVQAADPCTDSCPCRGSCANVRRERRNRPPAQQRPPCVFPSILESTSSRNRVLHCAWLISLWSRLLPRNRLMKDVWRR